MFVVHVFHIHQIHFLLTAVDGVPLAQPIFRDVLEVATWSGNPTDPFPNVTILLDLRSPLIVGQFPYHCHILGHEDNGMMAKIEVLPAVAAVALSTKAPQVSSIISEYSSSYSTSASANTLFLVVVIALPICGFLVLGLVAFICFSRKTVIIHHHNTVADVEDAAVKKVVMIDKDNMIHLINQEAKCVPANAKSS